MCPMQYAGFGWNTVNNNMTKKDLVEEGLKPHQMIFYCVDIFNIFI